MIATKTPGTGCLLEQPTSITIGATAQSFSDRIAGVPARKRARSVSSRTKPFICNSYRYIHLQKLAVQAAFGSLERHLLNSFSNLFPRTIAS